MGGGSELAPPRGERPARPGGRRSPHRCRIGCDADGFLETVSRSGMWATRAPGPPKDRGRAECLRCAGDGRPPGPRTITQSNPPVNKRHQRLYIVDASSEPRVQQGRGIHDRCCIPACGCVVCDCLADRERPRSEMRRVAAGCPQGAVDRRILSAGRGAAGPGACGCAAEQREGQAKRIVRGRGAGQLLAAHPVAACRRGCAGAGAERARCPRGMEG